MKRTLIALALVAAAPLAAFADTTKEDLKKLAKAGCGDEVILAFVRANGPVARLSTDDIVELKAAGISDKVLGQLLAPAPAPVTPAPASGPTELNAYRVVEREKVVEVPTTYVVEQPYYVASPTWSYGYGYTYGRSPRYGCNTYSYRPSCSTYSWAPRLSVGYSWGGRCRSGWSVGVRW